MVYPPFEVVPGIGQKWEYTPICDSVPPRSGFVQQVAEPDRQENAPASRLACRKHINVELLEQVLHGSLYESPFHRAAFRISQDIL
jgi:hypothetical protein